MTSSLMKIESEAAATSSTVQPLIVAVPSNDEYYVIVDDKKFLFTSAIRALDMLFKITMVLNLAYSREAKNFLLFIQRHVYDITTSYDKMSPCIYEVIQKLKTA